MGLWENNKFTNHFPGTLHKHDIVVKINDSYLGIGDLFWIAGEHYTCEADLLNKLESEYQGKVAHILELVRPKKSLGVHSLDVLTMRTPDDDVKVFSVLLWTDCTTNSSHSCQAGYVVDCETEMIVSAAEWYSAYFASMKAPLVGTKFPGVKEACKKAVAAHKDIEHKWLTVIGWDLMITADDLVFFEGNFAGARTPRRMFLSLANLMQFTASCFWPFGKGNSVTPHN